MAERGATLHSVLDEDSDGIDRSVTCAVQTVLHGSLRYRAQPSAGRFYGLGMTLYFVSVSPPLDRSRRVGTIVKWWANKAAWNALFGGKWRPLYN